MNKKKKAFTLTELLVVVVVIGVLSAVVLPKFSKVIETRRTTEAEELMGAIRTEQEKRCALDKEYATDFNGLSDIVKSDNTKNYTLTLASTGVNASRKDKYNYTLSIPSYADGRICCSGDDCDKLNKNYPKCNEFTPEASPLACAGEVEETPEPTACEKDPTSCECNPNQAKCCPAGTTWDGSACVTPRSCDAGAKPSDDGKRVACGGNTCGFQTVSYYCDASTNYEWRKRLTGTCVPEPPAEESCPEGAVGSIRTDEWACLDGEWVGMAGDDTCTCDPAKKPSPQRQTCNLCGEQIRQARCDYRSYSWVMDGAFGQCSVASSEDCDMCALDPSPQNCCSEDDQRLVDGSAQTMLPLMIFDAQTRRCVCPEGTYRRVNEYGFPECACRNVAADKAKCCPGEPREDGICYKFTGKWVLQKKENFPNTQWGDSTCNIPHDGSATAYPNDWECSENEIGEICTVVDDNHCAPHEDYCGNITKSTWKCVANYVHNGW